METSLVSLSEGKPGGRVPISSGLTFLIAILGASGQVLMTTLMAKQTSTVAVQKNTVTFALQFPRVNPQLSSVGQISIPIALNLSKYLYRGRAGHVEGRKEGCIAAQARPLNFMVLYGALTALWSRNMSLDYALPLRRCFACRDLRL